MRFARSLIVALVATMPLAACDQLTGLFDDADAPTNLTYQLIPSGDPSTPAGVLLMWEPPNSGRTAAFNVYGRAAGQAWQLRGTTTSPTFHDAGLPDDQYYVATRDVNGGELGSSNTITIDRHGALPAPQALSSISLNGAVQLSWASNAVASSSSTFDYYRIYSTAYDGTRGVCTTAWGLEGTTVSDGFLAANLTNGASRCFAVSAVSKDGHESAWSDAHLDTPRFDARAALIYGAPERSDSAAFVFLDAASQRLGTVTSTSRPDADLRIDRHADGTFWITPSRAGASLALYSSPAPDLSAIDRAASSGYETKSIQVLPIRAYLFRLQQADGVHFAAVRIAFVTADYIVFDWAYQSAAGNPELDRAP